MKILTANISLGLRDSDNLINNIRGLAAYHSWGSFLAEVFLPPLRGIWAGPAYSQKRVDYMRTNENLEAVFDLLKNTDPDVAVLNEVLPEIHGSKLESGLRALGFISFSYGRGAKYPDAYVSTCVASKTEAVPLDCSMPQTPHPGCGGGIAGLRLANGTSVIGTHTAMGASTLWRSQIEAISKIAVAERAAGNAVVITGDFNSVEPLIFAQESFKKLHLASADKNKTPTCPTSLPRFLQWSVDHIFIPKDWAVKNFKAIPFGSDHLALLAEVTQPERF